MIGIVGAGGLVELDMLVVVVVQVAAQNGGVGGRIALLARSLGPVEPTIDGHAFPELEGHLTVCALCGCVNAGCRPDLVTQVGCGERGLQTAGILPVLAVPVPAGGWHDVQDARVLKFIRADVAMHAARTVNAALVGCGARGIVPRIDGR